MSTPVTDYRSVRALCDRLNAGSDVASFSPIGIRHYVKNAEANGLSPHVRHLGRKILISESGFYRWLEERTTRESAVRPK